MWLGLSDRENLPPQLGFFEPARNRALENPRLALAETSPGDDEHAAPSRVVRLRDEGGEGPVCIGLRHSVQIEACFDFVQTTLQPFRVGAVDSGKVIERRHARRGCNALLNSGRNRFLAAARRSRDGRPAIVQGPYIANRFLPQPVITLGARYVARPLHFPTPDRPRQERYGDAWAHAHPTRCAARCRRCATVR